MIYRLIVKEVRIADEIHARGVVCARDIVRRNSALTVKECEYRLHG